ncbi:MAG: transglutaminase-like domain-containing protein [Anaerolineae bacterium]|jgi:hypothetical protein
MSDTLLDFYAQHGLMSDPGTHVDLFSNLPDDVPALCKVVQGLMLHDSPFWAEQYGYSIPPERAMEPGIRDIAGKLQRLLEMDARPLTEPRPYEHKLVCTCRDFALLLTAMLRHKGIPARVRFGFPDYFEPGSYGDHVVAEYWHADKGRWVLVDAQLDDLQCRVIGATFDPCDIPRELFVYGGQAWQKCQSGEIAPDRFGFGQFTAGWYEDHLICEFWSADAQKWVLVDAELDDVHQKALRFSFDPCDVPRDQFLPGGRAWKLCRRGEADPNDFGYGDTIGGLPNIRGNLVRDVAFLNKVEILGWDYWGLIEGDDADLNEDDLALLDRVAALSTNGDFDALRSLYVRDLRLRVPPILRRYDDVTFTLEDILEGNPSLAKYL